MVQVSNTTKIEWSTDAADINDIEGADQSDMDDEFYELMSRRAIMMESREVAEYAADLARELAILCRNARLDLVAYMLDAAADEAAQLRAASARIETPHRGV
jgi:hypothetical protein